MVHSESLSYWQHTTSEMPLSTALPYAVDVVVIGGGLLGAATTYWLARQGVQTALLERTALASGATGRNGGFVVAGPAQSYTNAIDHLGHETARAVMDMTIENRALLRQVLEEESIFCEYREPGTLRLALNETQAEQLKQEVRTRQTDGFPALFLPHKDVQQMIKTPLGPEILGARFLPEQGLVHSARLVQGLAQAALHRGAQMYQAEVLDMLPEGEYLLIRTAHGQLRAGAVVVAINAWTNKLLPELTDVIMPVREQMLAYAPIPLIFPTGVSATVITDEYWHQTLDGTILIGGCGSVAPNEDIGIWESDPTAVVQAAIEQVFPRLFPSLGPLHVVRRWAGLLGCTMDIHPLVDQASSLPHVWFVGGFSGHGMPFGLRFGQLLAETVVNGTMPSVLKPFRLNRPTLKRWKLDARDSPHAS